MKCSNCNKELTENMEIEHCRQTGTDYFCNHECAIYFYFEYMSSRTIDTADEKELENDGIYIKNGKLYKA